MAKIAKFEFDKNNTYTTKDVAFELYKIAPYSEKDFQSLFACVSGKFTKMGLEPINKQRQNRVFSGLDCQKVYDYFISRAEADQIEKQLTIELIKKDKTPTNEFNVRAKGKVAEELLDIKELLAPEKSNIDFVYDCIQLVYSLQDVLAILHGFADGGKV